MREAPLTSGYRRDIDGLRALAVGSVVIFHAFPWMVPGGFVGVDVFFVISGYLITNNIVNGLDGGSFRFRDFYARRARRIFPALCIVLVATWALAWVTLLEVEFEQLGKHIAGGALFVSNFMLWRESGYFDVDSAVKPLTHLWSLGIEEQFYVVWPAILWALARWRRWMLPATVVLAVASFASSVASLGSGSAGVYYSPLNRFWELLVGALLALGATRSSAIGERWRELGAPLGLVMIGVSMFAFDGATSFPGWSALLPTVGTALVIVGGANTLAGRGLSVRPLVALGLISYPLYLWHWPLLTIPRVVAGTTPSADLRVGVVVISVILAAVTYRLVELPLRRTWTTNGRMALLAVPLVAVATVGIVTHQSDGVGSRRVVALNPVLDDGEPDGIQQWIEEGCGLEGEVASEIARCFTDTREPVRYALIGDSKAYTLIGGFIRTSDERGRWTMIGGNGDAGAPVPMVIDHPAYETYQPLIIGAIDAVNAEPDIEVVVLVGAVRAMFGIADETSFAELPDSPNYALVAEGLRTAVDRLVGGGKKVVLYVDNPPLNSPANCLERSTAYRFLDDLLRERVPRCSLSREDFDRQTAGYRTLLADIAAERPDAVTVFDPSDVYFDDSGTARHLVDGVLMYSFTDHPSDPAADIIGERLNDLLAGL